MKRAFFFAVWLLVGIAGFGFLHFHQNDLVHEQCMTIVFMFSNFALVIVFDVLAFRRGAIATISQVMLHWQERRPWVVPLVFGLACILAGHFTVAHVPGHPFNLHTIIHWAYFYALEALFTVWLGATIFAQAPDKD